IVIAKASSAFTLNTDLKGYVSRDDGTTWTEAIMVTQEAIAGGFVVYQALNIDLSSQPAGTAVRWRITGTSGRQWDFGAVVVLTP
ncbi:hypothetical protein L9G16_21035, partial [Shewanella sp. A25]|nr:hypothetical protein [Shewanella shenzhenensis]